MLSLLLSLSSHFFSLSPCLPSLSQVRLDLVEQTILQCISENLLIISIVGVAGATETGSVDDLMGLARLAKKYKIHFHVDAAWGGPLVMSKRYKHLLKGIYMYIYVCVCVGSDVRIV